MVSTRRNGLWLWYIFVDAKNYNEATQRPPPCRGPQSPGNFIGFYCTLTAQHPMQHLPCDVLTNGKLQRPPKQLEIT